MSTEDKLLGEKIKTAREFKKLTQDKLGQLVGLSSQQIRRIEQGKSAASAVVLMRIARVFDDLSGSKEVMWSRFMAWFMEHIRTVERKADDLWLKHKLHESNPLVTSFVVREQILKDQGLWDEKETLDWKEITQQNLIMIRRLFAALMTADDEPEKELTVDEAVSIFFSMSEEKIKTMREDFERDLPIVDWTYETLREQVSKKLHLQHEIKKAQGEIYFDKDGKIIPEPESVKILKPQPIIELPKAIFDTSTREGQERQEEENIVHELRGLPKEKNRTKKTKKKKK